ncbi:YukJ family protein [Alkaliphilus hydrothermalis]|uniref:Uncharacterized protein YukJ n=1 Tax=Alkaliphilus hydrothermalis TaxID=1482730 RepID=A0ABS2NSF8_9FIRM|nr:YukJ family protein [Alkaliphilus hydrothermalis]MBM7615771.1 uncharacterized protein YukJ [Alkaliphilus hydrothermalis]
MPVKNYGVLKGSVIAGKPERNKHTPHYQIHMEGEDNIYYRVAINVLSSCEESKVLYLAAEEFNSSLFSLLPTLSNGFTRVDSTNKELAIDYIRSKLFDSAKMKPLMHHIEGPNNDLNDLIDNHIKKAQAEKATVYIYGSKFISKSKDYVFGFQPTNGIHNIHMNQGNLGKFYNDNGTFQDGCILIQYETIWVGIFLAFFCQSWCTDEDGNPIIMCRHNEVNLIL